MEPQKKIDQLRALIAAGDLDAAIRFAAKFPRLGEHKRAIMTAASAMLNPGFYAQMGKDPEQIIAAGRAAILERYGA